MKNGMIKRNYGVLDLDVHGTDTKLSSNRDIGDNLKVSINLKELIEFTSIIANDSTIQKKLYDTYGEYIDVEEIMNIVNENKRILETVSNRSGKENNKTQLTEDNDFSREDEVK